MHLSLSIYRIVSCWGPAWLCLCVCVGMRVCVHRCVCVCLFASMCAWISVCVSASICRCVFLCLCASLCVCVCLSWLQGVKSSDKSWRAVCDTIWRQARQLFDGSFLFAQNRHQWLFNILQYTFNFLKNTFMNNVQTKGRFHEKKLLFFWILSKLHPLIWTIVNQEKCEWENKNIHQSD